MAYRQEQKELRKPDELQRLGQTAVPWMERHGQTMLIAVAGVGVAGLIVSIVNTLNDRADRSASAAFGAALMVLDRDVNAAASPPPDAKNAPFTSEAEKDKALIASLTAFRASGPTKKAAASAALPMAQAMLRLGQAEQALPLIDEYLAQSDAADTLRPAAYEARGYALEAQKRYDDALAAYELLAAEAKTDFLKGMGQYHKARMLAVKGDLTGAAKVWAEVETLAPESSAARLAKERLQVLAAQGIVPPQAAVAPGADAGS